MIDYAQKLVFGFIGAAVLYFIIPIILISALDWFEARLKRKKCDCG